MKMRWIVLVVAAALAGPGVAAEPTPASSVASAGAHVAIVNGKKIGLEEYERVLNTVVRQKFYHRAPPEGQLAEVRREVAQDLVDRHLIVAEAEARAIPVDQGAIGVELEKHETQYRQSPRWQSMRERILPLLRRELAEKQMLAALERSVRNVPDPTPEAVRAYYDANHPLFTEPERVHASVILLKVDPSSSKAVRDQARQEGREVHAQLKKGADFAELAKIRSGDASAAKGGDLGYLHRGMLPDNLHAHMDALQPGAIGEPVDVLEGVAIFKLHDRTRPALREFEAVKSRATELLKRSASDEAWKTFVAGLRAKARIEMNTALFPAPSATKSPAESGSGAGTAAPGRPVPAKEGQWPASGTSRGG